MVTQKEHQKLVFNTDYLFNADGKYCRMLPSEHSAILRDENRIFSKRGIPVKKRKPPIPPSKCNRFEHIGSNLKEFISANFGKKKRKSSKKRKILIPEYFQSALSYHFPLRPLFCNRFGTLDTLVTGHLILGQVMCLSLLYMT